MYYHSTTCLSKKTVQSINCHNNDNDSPLLIITTNKHFKVLTTPVLDWTCFVYLLIDFYCTRTWLTSVRNYLGTSSTSNDIIVKGNVKNIGILHTNNIPRRHLSKEYSNHKKVEYGVNCINIDLDLHCTCTNLASKLE